MTRGDQKKPAVIGDGRLCSARSKYCGRYATQRLPGLMMKEAV
jgi:hypothetical protein